MVVMRQVKEIKDYFALSVLLLVAFQLLHSFTSLEITDLLQLASAASIILGGMIIWKDSDSIFGSLEKQKKKEFAEKKKPVNRNYLLALAAIFFAGIAFRLVNISDIGIYTDEFSTLIRAVTLVEHGTIDFMKNGEFLGVYEAIDYNPDFQRGYVLIWIVAAFIKAFGQSILVARLPFIIFSAATAIPLYFVGKLINRRVGIIAALIWLMSPWALVIGRFVREYAVFPFIYLILFLVFITFVNALLAVFEKERKMKAPIFLGWTFVVIFPLLYALYLDSQSSFQQILIPYFTVFIYGLYSFLKSKKISHGLKVRTTVFLAGLASIAVLYTLSWFHAWNVTFKPSFRGEWSELLFRLSPRKWFGEVGIYSYFLIFALGTMGSVAAIVKKKFPVVFFYALTLFVFLYAYSFHFARYARPRYGFVMHVWSIPILAFGVYLLYVMLRDGTGRLRKHLMSVVLVVLLLFTFNPLKTIDTGIYTDKTGRNYVVEEFLYKFDAFYEKYGGEFRDSSILCSACGSLYWTGSVDLLDNNVNSFMLWTDIPQGRKEEDFREHEREVTEHALRVLQENEHGWLILDKWRFRNIGRMNESFNFHGFQFEFVDMVNSFYLYRW